MSAQEPGDTLIEALRRANPVPMTEAEGRRSLPSSHALFAEIIAQPPRRVGSRVRRRALFVLIAIVLLALLVAGFMVVRRDRATEPRGIACYEGASLDSRRVITAGSDPANACSAMWLNGTFAKRQVVSRFDECVLPSGVAAVFPGESGSVCDRLHLPELEPGPRAIGDFVDETNRRVTGSCIGAPAAERIIKEELVKFGLDGWIVTRDPRPFRVPTPCASLYFDTHARRVKLIPIIDVRAGATPTT